MALARARLHAVERERFDSALVWVFAATIAATIAASSPPISLYLIGAVVAYRLLRKRKNPWAAAAASTLIPIMLGWGVLVVLLVAFNVVADGTNPMTHTATIRHIELGLLHLSRHADAWIKLAWWKVAALIFAATVFASVAPRSEAVTRFVAWQKYVKVIAGALVVATSFSFFTNESVLDDDLAATVKRQIVAEYTPEHERKNEEIAKYLATRSVAAAVESLPAADRRYIVALAANVESIHALDEQGRSELDELLGRRLAGGSDGPHPASESPATSPPTRHDGVPDAVFDDPERSIAEERTRADEAHTVAEEQTTTAIEAMLSRSLDVGTEPVAKRASELLTAMIASLVPHELADQLGEFAESFSEAFIEQRSEPFVKRYSSLLKERIRANRIASEPAGARTDVAASRAVAAAVTTLGVDRPAAFVKAMNAGDANGNDLEKIESTLQELDRFSGAVAELHVDGGGQSIGAAADLSQSLKTLRVQLVAQQDKVQAEHDAAARDVEVRRTKAEHEVRGPRG